MIMPGFGKTGGKFVVLYAEPSVMRKQALRDVEQIDRRRKKPSDRERKQGDERLDGNQSVW